MSVKTFNADVNHPSHTQGPVDGSLYATVTKNPKTAKSISFAVTNGCEVDMTDEGPHTTSIDSGISSTTSMPQQQYSPTVNGTSRDAPSAINVEAEIHHENHQSGKTNGSHRNFSGEQAELDELLNGLLKQIASFPDPINRSNKYEKTYSTSVPTSTTYFPTKLSTTSKPEQSAPKVYETDRNSSISGETPASRFTPKYQPSSFSDERPYHTRAGSRPFSYGVTAGSPAMQRRRLLSESSAYVCESTPSRHIEDEVFTDAADDLTWLQRQQQKLRAKREVQSIEDRHFKEQMMLAELRGTVSKRLPKEKSSSPSPSLTNPIHVHTNGHSPSPAALSFAKPPMAVALSRQLSAPTSPITPTRVSSRNITLTRCPTQNWQNPPRTLQRQQSDNSYDRCERPFVAVKKAHQLNREHMSTYGTTPEQALVSSPVYGNYYPYQPNSYAPYNRHFDYATKEDSPPRSQFADDDSVSATYSSIHQSTPKIKDGLGEVTPSFENGGPDSPSVYYGQSRRSSMLSLNDSEVISQHPVFVKDTSNYWYKPKISREEAINFLRDKAPGTFIVRDSNSFPGAFGIAVKVATLPPSVQNKTGDISTELVRHFLIEPTSKGVQLKGCANEPVFGSLSALVYQHSVTPMALPCKLIIPSNDPCLDTVDGIVANASESESATELLTQGAACNVVYLVTVDTECLTGPQAVRKSISEFLQMKPMQVPTVVHFKVSSKGITLTDNNHRLFFRRHYPLTSVSHCGLDPDDRRWTQQSGLVTSSNGTSRLFGFVAKKIASRTENQCHVFAEYESEQPASAIVSFVNKVLVTSGSQR
ncbi:tensin-like protein [Leptotrombidium deliense]|uniref:Tensin-like protein n=1 Tax=Leptotrombidium deliense TaxID=299467 RepID=A0A443SGR0_9ACAR|nr:tensin-like protein [Leptotrombidium deliense]